jgi:hypothetical protein
MNRAVRPPMIVARNHARRVTMWIAARRPRAVKLRTTVVRAVVPLKMISIAVMICRAVSPRMAVVRVVAVQKMISIAVMPRAARPSTAVARGPACQVTISIVVRPHRVIQLSIVVARAIARPSMIRTAATVTPAVTHRTVAARMTAPLGMTGTAAMFTGSAIRRLPITAVLLNVHRPMTEIVAIPSAVTQQTVVAQTRARSGTTRIVAREKVAA